jgi:hypothetical protein
MSYFALPTARAGVVGDGMLDAAELLADADASAMFLSQS